MNIWFGAKELHSSGHRVHKNPSENLTIFPPILGVKWGWDMENAGKSANV
jgi:hypothetical protein